DSARSPFRVTSLVLLASSGNAYRMRRLLVSPANWKSPIDCVWRGSITGGSQADARGRAPPRFGGLVLAGIQSGDGDGGAAGTRPPPGPATRAVAPTPRNPAPLTDSPRPTPPPPPRRPQPR